MPVSERLCQGASPHRSTRRDHDGSHNGAQHQSRRTLDDLALDLVLGGGAGREEWPNQLGDDPLVFRVVAVDRVALDVVEVGHDREVGVLLGQPEISADPVVPELGDLRGKCVQRVGDRAHVVGRGGIGEAEQDDVTEHLRAAPRRRRRRPVSRCR